MHSGGDRPPLDPDDLRAQLARTPWDGKLASRAIAIAARTADVDTARRIFEEFQRTNRRPQMVLPHLALARLYLVQDRTEDALALLRSATPYYPSDVVDTANLLHDAGDVSSAARLLLTVRPADLDDPKDLVPMGVALFDALRELRNPNERRAVKELAAAVQRRVLEVATLDKTRGRAALNLATMLERLRAPAEEIEAAFKLAQELMPRNEKVRIAREAWLERHARSLAAAGRADADGDRDEAR